MSENANPESGHVDHPPKKRFFLKHKKSSAFVVSVGLHVGFVVAAVTFVAVKSVMKEETTFEAKPVERPLMKLKRLQVPVKNSQKSQAPKLRQTIVSRPKTSVSIQMPEMTGMKGGIGYGKGSGLGGASIGFSLDLFGGARGSGNELIGTFYDLKQTQDGELTDIGEKARSNKSKNDAVYEAIDFIHRFSSSWSENRLKKFFTAPRLKYASFFMMPEMSADEAPKAFHVEDQVKPSFWVCLYKGQIAAPETGEFRFCGLGDDVLLVRVNGKLVLDASWAEYNQKAVEYSKWESSDPDNRKFPLEHASGKSHFGRNRGMVIGDWVPLKKGEPVNMEILISEVPGGAFCAVLLVEQKGKTYRMVNGRPVLPIFKTAEIPDDLKDKMKIKADQETADGPVFGVLTNSKK